MMMRIRMLTIRRKMLTTSLNKWEHEEDRQRFQDRTVY